jgi:pyrroline-5-carboxylate reductase
MNKRIAFIGGGNMASAIIGGLLRQGQPASTMDVVEPFTPARAALLEVTGLTAHAQAGEFLKTADMVIWAVKPQTFKDAALPLRDLSQGALHLSVAAGIPSGSIAQWLNNDRIVRTMPNTPALIGKGICALYARPGVDEAEKTWATQVMGTTGDVLWLSAEEQLDAVTALSGSGPAYMFYFMEAMTEAGISMGLEPEQAYQLAIATLIGAGELARASTESPEVLRQRVTSKGGTTYAAITSMEANGVKALFAQAMRAAQQRAKELGEEFGKD